VPPVAARCDRSPEGQATCHRGHDRNDDNERVRAGPARPGPLRSPERPEADQENADRELNRVLRHPRQWALHDGRGATMTTINSCRGYDRQRDLAGVRPGCNAEVYDLKTLEETALKATVKV
jgi:hypothetical protein